MLFTSLGRFRLVAFAEGVSAVLLFLVAMPLKYIFKIPEPTLYIGSAHGGLFVLYMLLLIQVTIEKNWSFQKFVLGTVASFVPFGTFYADARWFREKE
jgi:integral membrane protein